MKTNIFFLIIFLITSRAGHTSEVLHLLSMNVYMLPKPIKWTLQKERTEALAEQLKNTTYDLIFFQEAFTANFRMTLTDSLKRQYPYSYFLDKSGRFINFFNSGIFILSRHPFKVLDQIYFSNCSGFDCFASKGSPLIEITLASGQSYQFASTHLQAGIANSSLRLDQLAQIKKMLNQHFSINTPQFLIGDLNIDFADTSFKTALKLTDMVHAPMLGSITTTNARTNDCYNTPSRKLWIDHFWVHQKSVFKKFEMRVQDYIFKKNDQNCPLSDHHGVELVYIPSSGVKVHFE